MPCRHTGVLMATSHHITFHSCAPNTLFTLGVTPVVEIILCGQFLPFHMLHHNAATATTPYLLSSNNRHSPFFLNFYEPVLLPSAQTSALLSLSLSKAVSRRMPTVRAGFPFLPQMGGFPALVALLSPFGRALMLTPTDPTFLNSCEYAPLFLFGRMAVTLTVS